MSTEDKIAVMQAFEDGKPIECIPRKGCKWVSINDCIPPEPIWDWESCNYRIKPAPASQLDRIKAEYAEYEVVELVWDKRDLWTMKGHGCYDAAYLHTTAQSMKGFGWYVYDDDGLFLRLEAVIDNHDEALHPCAVLFTK